MELKKRASRPSLKSPTKPTHRYQLAGQIGKGQFGKVFEARANNRNYALKVISLSKIKQNPKLKKLINDEI